jgi:hypothetical protein
VHIHLMLEHRNQKLLCTVCLMMVLLTYLPHGEESSREANWFSVKKFPACYATQWFIGSTGEWWRHWSFNMPTGALMHVQVPATCPYPEPAQSSPCPHIPLLNIIVPSMPGSSLWALSLWFPHFSTPLYVLHVLPISFFSILSPQQNWVKSTDH